VTTLYLFSSNIRPQYEQDIVDVAAAPKNTLFRFRYERKYVDNRIRDQWRDNKLKGRPALVLYSIQQPARYHPPAFIPIREGAVANTYEEGSVLVVEFRLRDYAVIRNPGEGEAIGDPVASFSNQLRQSLVGHPGSLAENRRFSAVDGEIPGGFLTLGDSAEQFERLTGQLGRTVSFASYVFWRIAGISKLGSHDPCTLEDGRWRLESNTTYELTIVHYQPDVGGRPVGMTAATFLLDSDPSLLEIIGAKQFQISSRYDAIPVRLRVPPLTNVRETVLMIRPAEGTKGPRADLQAKVGPTTTKRVMGAVLAGLAVFLAAVPGMWNKASLGTKLLFGATAAALAVLIGLWALPVRRT
jgi:hypothetical protein